MLPDEIWEHIFAYVDQKGLVAFSQACKEFYRLRDYHRYSITGTQLLKLPKMLIPQVIEIKCISPEISKLSSETVIAKLLQNSWPRLRSFQIDRQWSARRADSLLSNPQLRNVTLMGYGQPFPQIWPPGLRTLVIRDIFLEEFKAELPHLESLDLNMTLVSQIEGVSKLTALYARCTRLKGVPNCPNLKRLNLSGTQVARLPELPLTHLDISRTLVRELSPNYTELVHLNISHTPIQQLSPNYTRLRVLKVEGCRLSKIPETYVQVQFLKARSLGGMRSLPDLPELTTLDIRDTFFVNLSSGYRKLKRLVASPGQRRPRQKNGARRESV